MNGEVLGEGALWCPLSASPREPVFPSPATCREVLRTHGDLRTKCLLPVNVSQKKGRGRAELIQDPNAQPAVNEWRRGYRRPQTNEKMSGLLVTAWGQGQPGLH